MLKQLAPNVVMPPSPKKSAWISSAIETARMEAHGPRIMAAMLTPTACPVVPPGSGRLNIITRKENAAKTDSSGISRVLSQRFKRRSATYQKGAEPAYNTAHVLGLR